MVQEWKEMRNGMELWKTEMTKEMGEVKRQLRGMEIVQGEARTRSWAEESEELETIAASGQEGEDDNVPEWARRQVEEDSLVGDGNQMGEEPAQESEGSSATGGDKTREEAEAGGNIGMEQGEEVETAEEGQLQPRGDIVGGIQMIDLNEDGPHQIGIGNEGREGKEVQGSIERVGEAGPSVPTSTASSGEGTQEGAGGSSHQSGSDGNQSPIKFKGKTCKLSNFYPCRVEIYGQVFTSSEVAYQWRKAMFMRERGVADQIRGLEEAREAKAVAKRAFGKQAWVHWDVRRKELSDRWDQEKIGVMRQILRAKARGCEEFVQVLRESEGRQLQENVPGERVWGIDQGSGQNWLGRLLMEVRDTLESTLSQNNKEEGTDTCPELGEGMAAVEGQDRGGNKRAGREEEKSCKRRRGVIGHEYENRTAEVADLPGHGIFFGSSQLRELVRKERRGLAASVILENWDVNMWRGGEIEHVSKMVREKDWEKFEGQLRWAVIEVGGNDIENTERVWEEQERTVPEGSRLKKIINTKLDMWRNLVRQVKRRVRNVVVWLPGIRQQGTQIWWNSWVEKLDRIAKEEGARTRWTMKREEGGEAEYWAALKETSGRQESVHYPEELMRVMLEETLQVLGEKTILKKRIEGIASQDVFRNRCGRCGMDTHERATCHREVKCKWCGREDHVEAVCLTRVTRCQKCGGKAHQGEGECTADRRTRTYSVITR